MVVGELGAPRRGSVVTRAHTRCALRCGAPPGQSSANAPSHSGGRGVRRRG
jgi:hypothetical protein